MRYILTYSGVALFLSASIALSDPIAQLICAPKDRMEKKLRLQYGSTPEGMGMRGPSEIMEIWTDKGGDWTLVISYSSGQSCIVAMGEDWQSFGSKKPA